MEDGDGDDDDVGSMSGNKLTRKRQRFLEFVFYKSGALQVNG